MSALGIMEVISVPTVAPTSQAVSTVPAHPQATHWHQMNARAKVRRGTFSTLDMKSTEL